MFPEETIGSIIGLAMMGGAVGGMMIAMLMGHILEWTGSFSVVLGLRERAISWRLARFGRRRLSWTRRGWKGEAANVIRRNGFVVNTATRIVMTGVLLAGLGCNKEWVPQNHGFPEVNEASGWTRTGKVRTFGASNLWKYDDGDAEKYIKAGVQSASVAEYKSKDQSEAVAEIYTMSNAAGAKAIFESEPAGDAKNAEVGDASRLYKQSLTFRTRVYLVRIVAFGETAQLEQELVDLGKGIERKLKR